MTGRYVIRGGVAMAAAALLIVAVTVDRSVEAQSQSYGAVLAGTWFIPGTVITAFFNYHQDGTMDGMRSHEFGGPPRPGEGRSNVRGFWRRTGNEFEAVSYNYRYDGTTGDALAIVRLRWVFSFDPGFESTSGEFFVTQWFCLPGVACPNPLVSVPDIPEFSSGPFTQVRLRQ